MKTAYWLFYGSAVIGSVVLPAGASDEEVKRKAWDDHREHPWLYRDHLTDRSTYIQHSTVKTYPNEIIPQ